ncbi:MAG: chemotaxis protein CheW [Gammaproteobacteria bacterium]|jgi:twitching motility protein PilI|nr:chemotaxis protein CheW [Gammaproteobacteria bacterium]
MNTGLGTELRSLKQHPFDLLQELEIRSKAALAGATGGAVNVEEWVGIGFSLADEPFIVAREKIREVLMVPALITRVPGAKSWVRGLANIRGHLLPIVDLKAFLGAGTNNVHRDARVLVLNSVEFSVGLIVDEVFGFRRFLAREHSSTAPQTVVRCDRYLEGAYERSNEVWPVLSIDLLLRSAEFQRAAE